MSAGLMPNVVVTDVVTGCCMSTHIRGNERQALMYRLEETTDDASNFPSHVLLFKGVFLGFDLMQPIFASMQGCILARVNANNKWEKEIGHAFHAV